MSESIQQKMHQEHVKWQSDNEAWLADIEEWKKELNTALTELGEAETVMRDSLDALESHANTIWENKQRNQAHELVLSDESRSHENKTSKDWEATHAQHASRHERVADTHERIKHYHHTTMAECAKLIKKVRAAL